jgi:hypothetical protein
MMNINSPAILKLSQSFSEVNTLIAPKILSFIGQLADYSTLPHLFNPWQDADINLTYDLNLNAAHIRRMQLAAYLNERINSTSIILIAEAPGYQGARFSGIPMTSERMLLGHHSCVKPSDIFNSYAAFPNINIPLRTSCPSLIRAGQCGMNEPTATIVWSHLLQAGFNARQFVLWNTVAFHPYQTNHLMTNRTPTAHEVTLLSPLLHTFLALFPQIKVLALGKIAYAALTRMGIECIAARHPSMGGANQFREQLQSLSY